MKKLASLIYSFMGRFLPRESTKRLLRFALVGVSGAVVNLVVLELLVRFGKVNAQLAILVALEVSILSNFFLNHYYTFNGVGPGSKKRSDEPASTILSKLVKYNLGTLGGAAITYAVFTLLYKWAGLHYLVSDALAIIVATGWNYYMSIRYVWKVVDK